MAEKISVQMVYLVPVLTSLLFGLACACLLLTQPVSLIEVAPFSENNASAPFGNAFYFATIVALSATVLYILLKRKSRKLMASLNALTLTATSLLLSPIYLSAIFAYAPNLDFLVLPLTVLITVIFDLAFFL